MKSAFFAAALSVASALAAPQLESRQAQRPYYQIHPAGDKSKCIGVLGGKFTVGSFVDIYDCNGSATQKWAWFHTPENAGASQVFVTNPANGKNLCMDVATRNGGNGTPGVDDLVDGTKLVLKECTHSDAPIPPSTHNWQSWSWPTSTYQPDVMMYWMFYDTTGNGLGGFCVDLTDGKKDNKNVLQIWSCNTEATKPWKNQRWELSNA